MIYRHFSLPSAAAPQPRNSPWILNKNSIRIPESQMEVLIAFYLKQDREQAEFLQESFDALESEYAVLKGDSLYNTAPNSIKTLWINAFEAMQSSIDLMKESVEYIIKDSESYTNAEYIHTTKILVDFLKEAIRLDEPFEIWLDMEDL